MPLQRLTYQRMDKDRHPSNFTPEVYYDARNIRIVSTDSNDAGNLSPDSGTAISVYIPVEVYNNPAQSYFYYENNEIGAPPGNVFVPYTPGTTNENVADSLNIEIMYIVPVENALVIFSVASNGNGLIWTYENNNLTLIYNNKLNFSLATPIRDSIVRVENSLTHKIYFTDYNNYLRYVNIKDPDLIDKPVEIFNITPNTVFTQPFLNDVIIGGGNFEPGIVKYAYSLYNYQGSESVVSPMTADIVLKNSEDLNFFNSLNIQFFVSTDSIFTNYKIYRIHYTSLNEEPTINLVIDRPIGTSLVSYTDNGTRSLAEYSVEEFVFLGGQPFKCKTLSTYKNRLLAGNIEIENFDFDFDTRVYRFDNTSTARLDGDTTLIFTDPDVAVVDDEHDCINPSNAVSSDLDLRTSTATNALHNKYIYQKNGTTLGGSGKYISYKILQDSLPFTTALNKYFINPTTTIYNQAENSIYKSYKRDEIYRFGIRFYNLLGQTTFTKWIGDIRMPNQDTHPIVTKSGSNYFLHPLYIEFSIETNTLPDEVVGWEIMRIERTDADKTIVAQGIVNTMLKTPITANYAGSDNYKNTYEPSYAFRTLHNQTSGMVAEDFGHFIANGKEINDDNELIDAGRNFVAGEGYRIASEYLQLHSPEIEFKEPDLDTNLKLSIVGGINQGNYRILKYKSDRGNVIGDFYNTAYHDARNSMNPQTPNEQHYFAMARKGAELIVGDNVGTVDIDGIKTIAAGLQDVKESFVTAAFPYTFDFRTSVYIQSADAGNNANKTRAHVGKCATFSIKDGTSLGLEKAIKNGTDELFNYNQSNPIFVMAELKRQLSSQYGGNTYIDRTRNEYQPVAHGINLGGSIATLNARYGDTYICLYNCLTFVAHTPESFIDSYSFSERIMFPVETSINLDAKNKLSYNSEEYAGNISVNYSTDFYDYNSVYSNTANIIVSGARPQNFNDINHYSNRVISSSTKINGEAVDSWSNFRTNDFLDLEGNFGPINAMEEFNDNIFVFQDRAVGRLLLQPNVQLSNTSGVEVQLGTGTFLYNYSYLSTASGCVNQFSVIKSKVGIYYFDANNKKIQLLSNSDMPISDTKGLHSWLKTSFDYDDIKEDNPLLSRGVSVGYDPVKMEIYFTFKTAQFSDTVCFNELLNGFTSFYDFKSSLYTHHNGKLLSVDNTLNGIWNHSGNQYTFYGLQYTPSITLVSSENATSSKVFDYLIFDSVYNNPDDLTQLLTSFEVWNSYQESGTIPITASNFKRRFREWRLSLPREQNSRNRFVSNYLYTKLNFIPRKYFSLSDVVVAYTNTHV